MVRKPACPISSDQPAFGQDSDIRWQGKGNDIGRQSLRHRSSLTRRTPVRLLDADSVTNFPLVLDDELGVDLFVDLAGGVVGDIENLTELIAIVVPEGD